MNGTSKDRAKRMEKRAENRAKRQISRSYVFQGTLGPCPSLHTLGVRAATHACDGLGQIVDIDTEQLLVHRLQPNAHVSHNLDMALASA